MSIIKRITSAGLSLAMAATIIPSSFAVSTKSASTLSSVTLSSKSKINTN